MRPSVEVLGAVHRGRGDAGWQQSGDRTVFALTGAPGGAGRLLDLLQDVARPSPETLAEAAREAGAVGAGQPILLGVLEGTELVLFGAGGASCRLVRKGAAQDLLDSPEPASYATGQAMVRRGDLLLCSSRGRLEPPGPVQARSTPADVLDLLRKDGLLPEGPAAAVLRRGQPARPEAGTGRSGRKALVGLLLLLLACVLVAAAFLLPWREAVGLAGSRALLPADSDVLALGTDEAPPGLGEHLDVETLDAVEGPEEGTWVLAETAPGDMTAVDRVVILRDSSDLDRAAQYLTSDLNYFQRGRTIVLNETGAALQGPMLDPGQFALFADLPARRGGSMVLEPGAEPRDLSGGPPEDLPGPAFRAVVVR